MGLKQLSVIQPDCRHGWLVFQHTESLAKEGDFSGVFEAHFGRRALKFLGQVDRHMAN